MNQYPPQGPPPAPPSDGTGAIILIVVFATLGFVVILGVVAWVLLAPRASSRSARSVPARAAPAGAAPALPPVTRHVPLHALSILDGCSDSDVRTIGEGIDGAIEIGAPLYNAGNFAGCYHLYEGTAADIEHRLSSTCPGPARALEAGRTRAASLSEPSDQAWAMRDAFDGLLDVLERSASGR